MTSMIPDAGKLLYELHIANVRDAGADYSRSVKNWDQLHETPKIIWQKTAEDLHKHWFQAADARVQK